MDPIRFLEELINIPSLSGEEEGVAERVFREFKGLGYDDIIKSGGNVCGVRGSGPVKLLYDAHMDVVDPGTGWEGDPYKARNTGERVIGRGASDDKGSLAAMVHGGAIADVSGVTLYVLGSVREEVSDRNGIREFLEKTGIRPDFAVVGEPSDLRVSLGNRGRVVIRIELQGEAGHASDPEAGVNAVYRASEVVDSVRKLNHRVSQEGDSVAVTRILTPERNINIIPEKCTIWMDYRSAPGREIEDILSLFSELTEERDTVECFTPYHRPWVIEKEHPLVAAALKSSSETGCSTETTFWNFCTNASFIAGELKIPTIGFGPGLEEDCHTAEESISCSQVLKAVDYLGKLPEHVSRIQT